MNEKFKKDEVWGYLGKAKEKDTAGTLHDSNTMCQTSGEVEGDGLTLEANSKVGVVMICLTCLFSRRHKSAYYTPAHSSALLLTSYHFLFPFTQYIASPILNSWNINS